MPTALLSQYIYFLFNFHIIENMFGEAQHLMWVKKNKNKIK